MNRDDGLRASLRELPVPDVSPDLLQRIVRSRVMGVRVNLGPRRWTVPWGQMAAAAFIVAFLVGSWKLSSTFSRMGESRLNRNRVKEFLRENGMWRPEREETRPRFTPQPKYALITSDDLDIARLSAGTWMYTVETTTDDVLTRRTDDIGIRLARSTYRGRPVWMINTGRQPAAQLDRFGDTTYLDPTALRPLELVAHVNRGRTRFSQTFTTDSVFESIEMRGPIQRSWHGAVLLPFPRNALFVSDWSIARLVPVLPAIPFSRRWSGTLYQVAFISQAGVKGIAPVDLKVVGTDRVTVPAGTYDCWRVEIGSRFGDAEEATLWISRDKGWLIQKLVRGGDFDVTTQLERYEPGN